MVPLAVGRARWLAELAQAIGDAQSLVWEMGWREGLSGDALDLYARLEVVRNDLDDIRRGRNGGLKAMPMPRDFLRSEAFDWRPTGPAAIRRRRRTPS